jgi:hypothetical protein
MLDDFLGLPFVQGRQFVSRLPFCTQQLVELGVDGLGIPPLGPLDEHGHEQSCDLGQ